MSSCVRAPGPISLLARPCNPNENESGVCNARNNAGCSQPFNMFHVSDPLGKSVMRLPPQNKKFQIPERDTTHRQLTWTRYPTHRKSMTAFPGLWREAVVVV